MESILHIETITRGDDKPLSIGETEYVLYGDGRGDEDNLGETSCHILLGSPLEGIINKKPTLIKTFEFVPDTDHKDGNIFTETIHYLKDRSTLVPFRTKIRSGPLSGKRFIHLPSLNETRDLLVGYEDHVCNPVPEMIKDLLDTDYNLRNKQDHPAVDWIKDKLCTTVASSSVSPLNFNSDSLSHTLQKCVTSVADMPFYDMSQQHLRDIYRMMDYSINDINRKYYSKHPISIPTHKLRAMMVPHGVDLTSFGNLKISNTDVIVRNPHRFGYVSDLLDTLPLTDLNVDLVLGDGDVTYMNAHIAVDRVSAFQDKSTPQLDGKEIIEECLDRETLLSILSNIVHHHPSISDTVIDIICSEPVKIKIVKTILDEAVVFLYRFNSDGQSKPLCGVYFDLAELSLAPLTVIPGFTPRY